MRLFRRLAVPLACALALVAASASAGTARPAGYASYRIGDLAARRPGPTAPALMLMGGGAWPEPAFRWFVGQAGHGHVVILRASGADDLQERLYRLGGVASVQTLVFHDRAAASDPAVLEIVRRADGIFIAGGDQANYVRFWKGTPLNALLDRHVRAGKPIGGTSAGLAILGGHGYGALDGGSIVSKTALADPLGGGVTLVDGFLHMPRLERIVTDTHFAARGRLGRLIAFVARLRHEGHAGVVGLGVDEATVLAVDGAGIGRLFTRGGGYAWLVRPRGAPRIVPGRPLDYPDIRLTGIGPDSRIDLRDLSVKRPAFEGTADVRAGHLAVRDVPLPEAAPRADSPPRGG